MPEPVIVVTGANGQLGKEIKDLENQYPQFHFILLSKEELSIDDAENVQAFFEKWKPQYCINCAAYTAVDKAETDRSTAMLINGGAVGILAGVCKSFNTRFIHISTDYVFNGTADVPYRENDKTDPVNYYGVTKLAGEELASQKNNQNIIIRTSWVYSVHGNNFVKTMMRLMKEREQLNVVSDQVGSPTYAADLAKVMLSIIEQTETNSNRWVPGIYHYSNDGVITWYDFAAAIKRLTGSHCTIHPIAGVSYPTPARRPAYSAFNKDKIKSTFSVPGINWEESLSAAIKKMI